MKISLESASSLTRKELLDVSNLQRLNHFVSSSDDFHGWGEAEVCVCFEEVTRKVFCRGC